MRRLRWSLVVLVGCLASACGGSRGAEPAEVREHLDEVAVPLVDDSAAAFDFLDDSSTLEQLGSSLSAFDGALSGLPFELGGTADDVEPGDVPEPIDPAEPTAGEQMAEFLRERIFIDENYEGDGVYRIDGADVCEEDAPDCIENVDRAQLRIEVLIVDGGIDVSLLIGPGRSRPLTLESREDRITIVTDLGESRDAIDYVASLSDAEQEIELPDTLEGVVAATLRRNGDADVTVELAIREAIEVSSEGDDGSFVLRASAKDPAIRVRIDALDRRLAVDLDAPAVYAAFPWSLTDDESAADGTFVIDWQGLSGSIEVDDQMQAIALTNLGLGDGTSTLSLDGHQLLAVDLNADDGRAFDLTITPEGDSAAFAFDPAFDLRVEVDFAPLATAGDEIDPYLIGQTYEVRFDALSGGDAPTALPIAPTDTSAGGLQIVSGRLTVSASGADPLVVEQGSCLLSSEVVDGENPVLGALSSGACP